MDNFHSTFCATQGTGALLRRSLFDGSGDPSCLATFAVPRGPLADAVFVLSTDWSLVALLKDRTEAWEKRFLVGPNPKRFKEKPLSQVHAAVSPKLPLLFFVRQIYSSLFESATTRDSKIALDAPHSYLPSSHGRSRLLFLFLSSTQ